MEDEGDNYTKSDCCCLYRNKRIIKEAGGLKVGGGVETIQTTALLRMARILERVQET